jgi:recombinational DNA repair protein RecR
MPDFAGPLAHLIDEFKRLPGVGQKSAQRLAFHVLRAGREDAERLSRAILDVSKLSAISYQLSAFSLFCECTPAFWQIREFLWQATATNFDTETAES